MTLLPITVDDAIKGVHGTVHSLATPNNLRWQQIHNRHGFTLEGHLLPEGIRSTEHPIGSLNVLKNRKNKTVSKYLQELEDLPKGKTNTIPKPSNIAQIALYVDFNLNGSSDLLETLARYSHQKIAIVEPTSRPEECNNSIEEITLNLRCIFSDIYSKKFVSYSDICLFNANTFALINQSFKKSILEDPGRHTPVNFNETMDLFREALLEPLGRGYLIGQDGKKYDEDDEDDEDDRPNPKKQKKTKIEETTSKIEGYNNLENFILKRTLVDTLGLYDRRIKEDSKLKQTNTETQENIENYMRERISLEFFIKFVLGKLNDLQQDENKSYYLGYSLEDFKHDNFETYLNNPGNIQIGTNDLDEVFNNSGDIRTDELVRLNTKLMSTYLIACKSRN